MAGEKKRKIAARLAAARIKNGRERAARMRESHNSGWRKLGPFGLFRKPERENNKPLRDEDGNTLLTFPAKWRYMRPIQRILYLIYFIPLFSLFSTIALVLFLPWRYLRFTRPRQIWMEGIGEKRIKHKKRLDYNDPKASNRRDVCAPIGLGHYHKAKDGFRDPDLPRLQISRAKSLVLRIWDWHCLQRDLWKTCERQGMQVLGVLCGSTMLIMEVVRIGTELGGPSYVEAKATGGGTEFMTVQPDCAYVPGTGFANWGSGWEAFGWYTLYHGWIVLLCLLLIIDETLNVRMGLFAPQHTRGGTGYTIIFLALCLLNSSPNWGVKGMIPIHRFLLFAILTIGLYNVLRIALAFLDCTPDKTMQRENRRNGRFPLRPWTNDQWLEATKNGNHNFRKTARALARTRQAERLAENPNLSQEELDQLEEAFKSQNELDKLYFFERIQAHVGDHCFELKNTKDLLAMKADWGVYKKGQPRVEGGYKMKEDRSDEERIRFKGQCQRSFIHGWPLRPVRWTTEDHYLIARGLASNYFAESVDLDRFLVYDSTREPFKLNIAGEIRYAYKDRYFADIIQPTEEEVKSYNRNHNYIPPGLICKWENEEEFKARRDRDKKCGEDYYGNHNWISPIDRYKGWYIWFDIRRAICVIIAVWTLVVHIFLLVYNLGTGSNNWPIYNAQYEEASSQWRANGGRPKDDQCQYYQGSSIPIWVSPGVSAIQSVFVATYFYLLWELFIIHLLMGVILVGLSNNRTYGMHIPWPITLIGPRLSSVSLGWTIGFVGAATLQLGLFHYDNGMQGFAQGAGYCCIGTWALFLFRNENMMQTVTRRPFPAFLSLWAHEWMDGKLVYKYTEDAEYD